MNQRHVSEQTSKTQSAANPVELPASKRQPKFGGRKSEKQAEEHRGEVAYYKWEFLRRNKEYRQDYRTLMTGHEKTLRRAGYLRRIGYPRFDYAAPGYAKINKERHLPRQQILSFSGLIPTKSRNASRVPLPKSLAEKLGQLHRKWAVGFMQNPHHKISQDIMKSRKGRRRENPFWGEFEQEILCYAVPISWDTVRFHNLSVDLRFSWEWIPVAINLRARPTTLLQQLESLLKRVRKARASLTEKSPATLESPHFDSYIAAWDKRAEGYSILSIAKAERRFGAAEYHCLKKEHSNKLADIRRNVARELQRAKALIAGGYRYIS